MQPRVFGFVDDTHAAIAELFENAIVRNGLAASVMKSPAFGAHIRLREGASQRTPSSHRVLTEAAITLSFGSPSSPTEGLKITVFPGKRHQTRHLDFAILLLLTEMLEVRILSGEPNLFSFNQLRNTLFVFLSDCNTSFDVFEQRNDKAL
jgi:hypothetical protein